MLQFIKPTDEKINKENQSTSISDSNSPFQNLVTFQITGFTYKQAEIDGKVADNARMSPVLTTTIGDMFLSMCTKWRVTSDGECLEPKGSFNIFVKDTIQRMSGKTNGEILQAIVDGAKDKTIIVSRTPYSAMGANKRIYTAFDISLSFKA